MLRVVAVAVMCCSPAFAGPTPFAPAPLAPVPISPAAGGPRPQPIAVPLPAPPAPFTPAMTAIGTAYSAINRAAVLDPAAAARAQFAYRQALSRLKMGDPAGAAAYAASALAIANAGAAGVTVVAPASAAGFAGAAGVASAQVKRYGSFGDVSLPDYLITVRDRVWRARAHGADVTVATRHLRDAVDAWLAGDAARARREAQASTAALSVPR